MFPSSFWYLSRNESASRAQADTASFEASALFLAFIAASIFTTAAAKGYRIKTSRNRTGRKANCRNDCHSAWPEVAPGLTHTHIAKLYSDGRVDADRPWLRAVFVGGKTFLHSLYRNMTFLLHADTPWDDVQARRELAIATKPATPWMATTRLNMRLNRQPGSRFAYRM